MTKLVFVDAGVLIAAARGTDEVARQAIKVFDDPDATFASSEFVKLEVLPKPQYNRRRDEVDFYEVFFASVSVWAPIDQELVQQAYDEAVRCGLSAVDALHVAAAARVGANELITSEGSEKPLHRSKLVPIKTIVPGKQS